MRFSDNLTKAEYRQLLDETIEISIPLIQGSEPEQEQQVGT